MRGRTPRTLGQATNDVQAASGNIDFDAAETKPNESVGGGLRVGSPVTMVPCAGSV